MPNRSSNATVAFGFNTDFQRNLLAAWSPTSTSHIKHVLLSSTRAPNARQHAETAFKSARKVPKGQVGERLKLSFLTSQYNWIFKYLQKTQPDQVLIYNGLNGVNLLASTASRELGLDCLFFERAPLQDRIQIDTRGVNFDSSVPRNIDFYARLAENELPKYETPPYIEDKLGGSSNQVNLNEMPHDCQRYVLCPLQVPRDTQITVFGGWVRSIDHLLESLNQASQQLPNGWHVRIKEHPSSPQSFRELIASFNNPRLVLDARHDVYVLLKNSSAVVTINSSVGLEAFTFEKSVITLGDALYSFGDLTSRVSSASELVEAFQDIENLAWSTANRRIFLRFLQFWYPNTESVLNGSFSAEQLAQRDEQFRRWLDTKKP